jgi:hypothetical protein
MYEPTAVPAGVPINSAKKRPSKDGAGNPITYEQVTIIRKKRVVKKKDAETIELTFSIDQIVEALNGAILRSTDDEEIKTFRADRDQLKSDKKKLLLRDKLAKQTKALDQLTSVQSKLRGLNLDVEVKK